MMTILFNNKIKKSTHKTSDTLIRFNWCKKKEEKMVQLVNGICIRTNEYIYIYIYIALVFGCIYIYKWLLDRLFANEAATWRANHLNEHSAIHAILVISCLKMAVPFNFWLNSFIYEIFFLLLFFKNILLINRFFQYSTEFLNDFVAH